MTIAQLTTCSSSAPELSSGIVSGKTLSFGDDIHVLCCWSHLCKIIYACTKKFRQHTYLILWTHIIVNYFGRWWCALIRKRLARWTFDIWITFNQTKKQRNEEKWNTLWIKYDGNVVVNDGKYLYSIKTLDNQMIKADSLPPTKTSSDNMWCLVDLKDWLQKRRGLARQCAVKQDASGCRHSYIADHIFRPFSNRKFVLKSMSFKWLHRGANK